MHKILVIEDAKEFQLLTSKVLRSSVNAVTLASTREEAMCYLGETKFDLILLDVDLPDGNGFSLYHELQASPATKNIPVIYITGKSNTSDAITGFSLGADDFITKPIEPLVFRAQIETKLKKIRQAYTKEDIIEIDGLQVNLPHMKAYQISENGTKKDLQLTPTEFKLLRQMIRSPERVFSREVLLNMVWGQNGVISDQTVDVHLSSLRRKLGAYSECIEAVQEFGYRFHLLSKEDKNAA